MAEDRPRKQLEMVWPERLLASPPSVILPKGYTLRPYQEGDKAGFFRVMTLAGFEGWDDGQLAPFLPLILSDGWFLILFEATGEIVATAMALARSTDHHPAGAELGWVAAHPAHAGKGLGFAVCAAATARLIESGSRDIYLKTDNFRLAAIKTYLKLGYIPFLYTEEMPERWRHLCRQLDWPYTPQDWPTTDTAIP